MQLERLERDTIDLNLNNQQQVLLALIIHHPHSSPTELSKKMAITRSAVSQQLAKLENDGYIVRIQDKTDKRAYIIQLDKHGQAYKKAYDQFNKKLFEKYNSTLSEKELYIVLSSVKKLQLVLDELASMTEFKELATYD